MLTIERAAKILKRPEYDQHSALRAFLSNFLIFFSGIFFLSMQEFHLRFSLEKRLIELYFPMGKY